MIERRIKSKNKLVRYFPARLGIFFLLTLLASCDGVPRLPTQNATTVSGDVVTKDGRGGYQWALPTGEFEIKARSDWQVFDSVDLEKVHRSIPINNSLESKESVRPEGLSNEVYPLYRRIVEPYADAKPALSIPLKTTKRGCYSISPNGKRLAVAGKHLEIWNLVDLKIEGRLPISSSDIRRVHWCSDSHILVVEPSSVSLVDAGTGDISKQWRAPEGDEPVYATSSGKVPVYAVTTKAGKMFTLDEDFQLKHSYRGGRLQNSEVSIHHEGKFVLSVSENEIVQWNLTSSKFGDNLKIGDLVKGTTPSSLLAGSAFNYVNYRNEFHTFSITDQMRLKEVSLSRQVHAACLGTNNFTEDWITCCLSRFNASGNREYFVQDFFPGDDSTSSSFLLGEEPILEMLASRSTSVLATRDKEKIHVYFRQSWKFDDPLLAVRDIANLVLDGKTEQAEQLIQTLSKMPMIHGVTGYQLHTRIANQIGKRWASLDTAKLQGGTADETSQKQLKALGEWRSKGSELSILASANRHYVIAWQVRLGKLPWSGDEESEFVARMKKIGEEVKPLLAKPNPSSGALFLALSAKLGTGKNPNTVQEDLKCFLESYIFDVSIHETICMALSPQWGGTAGAAGKYLTSVTDLLPQPQADLLYGSVSLLLMRFNDLDVFTTKDCGFSAVRTLRAADVMIKQGVLSKQDAESLIILAENNASFGQARNIVKYCLEKFSLVPNTAAPSSALAIVRDERTKLLNRLNVSEKE